MTLTHFKRADWARDEGCNGGWSGGEHGAEVCFLFAERGPGYGPRLHRHAYDEVQFIRRGRARFIVGGDEVIAEEGDILIVAAGIAHRFTTEADVNEIFSVQLTGKMEAEWLDQR